MINDVAEVRGTVKKYTAQIPPLNFNQRLASVDLLFLKSIIYRDLTAVFWEPLLQTRCSKLTHWNRFAFQAS